MIKRKAAAAAFYLRSVLAVILAVPFIFVAPSVAAFVFLILMVVLHNYPRRHHTL